MQAAMKDRGWTQDDLARVTGYGRRAINEIIGGKRSITPEMAVALGTAFGTDPAYWLRLETDHQLSLVEFDSSGVERRARVYAIAPVKDMQRRGWITSSNSPEDLERELQRFFGTDSLDLMPDLSVMTRKTEAMADLSPSQRAWCFRARQMAGALVDVKPFDPKRLPLLKRDLRRLAAYPSETRRIPEVMSKYGVRFIVIEPLPGSKIDGAAFWLADDKPIVAVSARFDRVDAFWFTVMHEVAHVERRDGISVDTDLAGDDLAASLLKSEAEQRADAAAAASLIDPAEIESFIHRNGPLYAKDRIVQFAHRIKMHPGIIVGQLQHRGEIGYSANREMLAKVRIYVTSAALTDGWGHLVPSNLFD